MSNVKIITMADILAMSKEEQDKLFSEIPAFKWFEKKEAVNHPEHYNKHPSGVECITIIEHMPFNPGNCIKYLWRAGLKSSDPRKHLEDVKKAAWYCNREVERLEKELKEEEKKANSQIEVRIGSLSDAELNRQNQSRATAIEEEYNERMQIGPKVNKLAQVEHCKTTQGTGPCPKCGTGPCAYDNNPDFKKAVGTMKKVAIETISEVTRQGGIYKFKNEAKRTKRNNRRKTKTKTA